MSGEGEQSSDGSLQAKMEIEPNCQGRQTGMPSEEVEQRLTRALAPLNTIHGMVLRKFSIDWTEKVNDDMYRNPVAIDDFVEQQSLEPLIDDGLGEVLADRLKACAIDFVAQLMPQVLCYPDNEDFLNFFVECYTCNSEAFRWVKNAFTDMDEIDLPGDDDQNFHSFYQEAVVIASYEACKKRMQEAMLQTLHKLRSNYAYCFLTAIRAKFNTSVLQIPTDFLHECAKIRSILDEDELRTFWWDPFVNQMLSDFISSKDLQCRNLDEAEYLSFAERYMYLELDLFKKLPSPPEKKDWADSVEKLVKEKLCDEYLHRSRRTPYFTRVGVLEDDESIVFDNHLFKILVDIHMGSTTRHADRFVDELKLGARRKILELLHNHQSEISLGSEWPLADFGKVLKRLVRYEEIVSKRLQRSMEFFPGMSAIVFECRVNRFSLLKTIEPISTKIAGTQDKMTDFLFHCSNSDFEREKERMTWFFRYVCDREKFVRTVRSYAERHVGNGNTDSLRGIATFVRMEGMTAMVTDELREFLDENNVLSFDA